MPNVLAGGVLDRAHMRRVEPDWLAERLGDSDSRVVLAAGTDIAVTPEDPPRAARLPLAALPPKVGEPVFLGVEDDAALFGVDVSRVSAPELAASVAPGGMRGLRDVGALLSPGEGGMMAYATAILNWHRSHMFCAVSGHPSAMAEGGHLRVCTDPGCGAKHFPRTDPVVIMLVEDGERCVLGRQAIWPARRYSALAGFVEPGESLEDAVAREVGEEAGLAVGDVQYHSSQPWPFPSSLMLGFTARYAGGDLSVGDQELEDVRWLSRAELNAAVESGELLLPPRVAIARRLIDDWLAADSG